jgi:FkbM family methyltransferase
MKSFIKKAIALTGFDIRRAQPEWSLDIAIRSLVSAEPIVFDVGANTGQSSAHYLHLFRRPIIHAFEPDPRACAEFAKNLGHANNVFLNPVGIGERIGTLTLNRTNQSDQNSFLPINLQGTWYTGQYAALRPQSYASIDVPVVTLDDYAARHGIQRIDFLKLDTQGFEPQCLAGAANLLRQQRIRMVQCEIIFGDLYGRPHSFFDVEKVLIPAGFRLFGLFDLAYHPSGELRNVDALYVLGESA